MANPEEIQRLVRSVRESIAQRGEPLPELDPEDIRRFGNILTEGYMPTSSVDAALELREVQGSQTPAFWPTSKLMDDNHVATVLAVHYAYHPTRLQRVKRFFRKIIGKEALHKRSR